MFGISLSKIIFTIFIVLAVFWVYRQINLLTDGKSSSKDKTKSKGSSGNEQSQATADAVEELTACPACGAYVAVGSNPGCGRPAKECPMQT